MATKRKITFVNDYIYHVFNRSIERRPIFTNRKEYDRALQLLKFYRHKNIPIRYSQLLQRPKDIRNRILEDLFNTEQIVEVLCFCLMPNHFHFMLKQKHEGGIARFISNFTNAYTKYFNTKYERLGPLFQGVFKAVIVESDEQLVHLSRYIHLNPVVSSIIKDEQLETYAYSSYLEYLSHSNNSIVNKELVLSMFKTVNKYEQFVVDQIDYAKKLDKIKHLTLE